MTALFILLAAASLMLAAVLLQRNRRLQREAFIRRFELPQGLFERLRAKRPELSLKDCQLVAHGLRQFFLAHLKSKGRYVSMPSQVVDDLWHEFILFTRNYEVFCSKAFGRFMHHSPAVGVAARSAGAAAAQAASQAGLRRVWWQACLEENINPAKASRLPLLFALDTKLRIADGFHYLANCESVKPANGSEPLSTDPPGTLKSKNPANAPGTTRVIYCGADVASIRIEDRRDGGGCGGGCGAGVSQADSSDGGGGDGGSGCGGGGCGGD